MNQFVNWLAPHLPLAVATLTLLLAIGCACLALTRSPAHRQRIGELTIAGALVWLVLALIPLPRLLRRSLESTELQDAGAPRHARTELLASAPQGHRLLSLSPLHAPSSAGEQIPLAGETTPDIPILPSESSVAAQVEPSHSAIGEPNRVANSGRDLPADFGPHVVADVPTIHPPRAVEWEIATWICLAGAVAGLCWLMLGHALLIRERFTAAPPPVWLFRLFQRAAGVVIRRSQAAQAGRQPQCLAAADVGSLPADDRIARTSLPSWQLRTTSHDFASRVGTCSPRGRPRKPAFRVGLSFAALASAVLVASPTSPTVGRAARR